MKLAFDGRPNVTAYPTRSQLVLHDAEGHRAHRVGVHCPGTSGSFASPSCSATWDPTISTPSARPVCRRRAGAAGAAGSPSDGHRLLGGDRCFGRSFRQRACGPSLFPGGFASRGVPNRLFGVACAVFGALVFILGANTVSLLCHRGPLAGLWNANSSPTRAMLRGKPAREREVPPEGAPSPSSSPRTLERRTSAKGRKTWPPRTSCEPRPAPYAASSSWAAGSPA